MQVNKLINWQELSRQLTGDGQNIRSNQYAKKHERKVKRLIRILECWIAWANKV